MERREVRNIVLTKDQKLATVFATVFLIGVALAIPCYYTGITYADSNLVIAGDFFIIVGLISAIITVLYYTHVKELPEIKNKKD